LEYLIKKCGVSKILVLTPLSIKTKWEEEIKEYSKYYNLKDIMILDHFENSSKYHGELFSIIIIDEIHIITLVNGKGKKFTSILQLKAQFTIAITATLYDSSFNPYINTI
jgi:superfamily II DNA or RNA helicase